MYSTTLHKIITIFLKGQFTIYIKKLLGSPLYYDMVLSRQYWRGGKKKGGLHNILKSWIKFALISGKEKKMCEHGNIMIRYLFYT